MKLFDETRKNNEFLKPVEEKYRLNNDQLQEVNETGIRFLMSKFFSIGTLFFNKKKPKYLSYINPNKEEGNNKQAVRVIYCIDGDTFVGIQNGEKKNYRLSAIDTPELGLPWSMESKALLETMINKKVVYVTYFGLDKYGRKIVDCFLDQDKKILVNNALIKEGLSHYHNYTGINKFHTHNFLQIIKKQLLYVEAHYFQRGRWSDDNDNKNNKNNTAPKNRW